ncbi:uncharacterized protein LOC144535194 [Sander vitreus]
MRLSFFLLFFLCKSKGTSTTTTRPITDVPSLNISNTTAAEVGEHLGIAAFVLSLLALSINLAILFWLGWQRFGTTLNINTAAKGFPGPEKSPKGDLPQTESDGDVYMNYTSQAYCDWDPTIVSGDNVYSSLS